MEINNAFPENERTGLAKNTGLADIPPVGNSNSNQLLSGLVIENLTAGILLEDHERKVVLANQIFCDFFQIRAKPGELVGLDCSIAGDYCKDLFHNSDEFISRIENLVQMRKLCMGEKLEMINGLKLERDFIPIFNEKEFEGFLWQYRDITQIQEMQARISESENKYRSILENMNLGILEVDNDDVIQKAYEKFCKLVGYEENELIGKVASEILVADEHAQQAIHKENNRRLSGENGVYEVPLKRKDGQTVWVIISGAPIFNKEGKVVGSIGIHHDITDRKESQKNLESARRIAEEAVLHEKRFLANMSHDIRTPLHAISGMAHLLNSSQLDGFQREFTENILHSCKILTELVNDILDFAKIDAGEMRLNSSSFDIRELCDSIIKPLRANLSNRIEFGYIMDNSVPRKLRGDSLALSQILTNLLNNSQKFTEKGFIRFEVRALPLSNSLLNLSFMIQDSGIGIPEDQLENIFETFRQADQSIRQRFGGTGLGLSIVKKLVELMRGDISVRSKMQAGSTFQVTLPFEVDEEESLSQNDVNSDSDRSELAGLRILIVEDNYFNRMYLTELLKKWEVEVVQAESAGEFALLESKERFDLILMDVQLGDGNGNEITSFLRTNYKSLNQSTPVIGLSASAFEIDRENSMAAGMNHYLPKPFTPAELRHVISDVLSDSGLFQEVGYLSAEYPHILKSTFENDVQYAHRMTKLFLRSVQQKNSFLETDADWDKTRHILHQLSSEFGIMGFSTMSTFCSDLEKRKILWNSDSITRLKTLVQVSIQSSNGFLQYLEEIIQNA